MACVYKRKGVDRISNLHDALLSHTLSSLPADDAFRTTFLSNRRTHVFASTPVLDFDDGLFCESRAKLERDVNKKDFVNLVYGALLRNGSAPLNKFGRRCYRSYDGGRVNSWISAALCRFLREHDLEFLLRSCDRELPCDLFNSKTLVALTMMGAKGVKVPNLARLPSLMVLRVSKVSFGRDGSASRVVSACRVHEELDMRNVRLDGVVITISICTVKRLRASWLCGAEFVLDTPRLDSLCFHGMTSSFTWGNDVKSLEMAYLEISLIRQLLHYQDCSKTEASLHQSSSSTIFV